MRDYNSRVGTREWLRFLGTVQGVGFLSRAMVAADDAGVTGWAHSAPDGAVCMELQGTRDQIAHVIRQIQQGKQVEIRRIEVRTIPLRLDETLFRVI